MEKEREKVKIFKAATGEVQELEKIHKSDQEWQKILTPEQFRVTRLKGTERAFTGYCLVPGKGESGVYQCVCCGTDLFKFETKFESGTGWPSFWAPVSELNIKTQKDESSGLERVEVLCSRCEAHLGHVFDDGPPPTGQRYCINAVALKLANLSRPAKIETATFGAGCFWGVEEEFSKLKGVVSTRVGYAGGNFKNPTYEEVCSGKTGHTEVVEVKYNPDKISYQELLNEFWKIHEPTVKQKTQYKSVIFYHNQEQKVLTLESKRGLGKENIYKSRIATEILPAKEFYLAEEYHQQYLKKHGSAVCP